MLPSLTRRNFMKLVAALGASTFLNVYKTDIAKALTAEKDYWHICWLNGAACTGCTISFAQASNPDLVQILTEITVGTSGLPIALPDYMETIHPASGSLAESLKERWKAGTKGKKILVVEGAVQDPGFCVIAGKDFRDHVRDAAEVADAIVAVGQCATYGGIPAAKPNPTNAKGLSEFLKEEGIGKPVINLPLCPANGEHIVVVLSAVIMGIKPELDSYGRPKALFGTNMHEELCPYRPYYDRGIFIEEPGKGEGCRYKLGCKGPVTYTDCPSRRWNGRTSYCVEAGAPCIGCSEPGWPDKFSPFYKELSSTATVFGIDPATLGGGILAATAAGIGVHAIRRKLRGDEDEQSGN